MDPLDFYELSKEIRNSTSSFPEALKRTIVGRIYYAVFLTIRDELGIALRGSRYESIYRSISQKGVIHSLVWRALREVNDGHLSSVLHRMRRRRDAADYRMQIIRNWEREIDDCILDAKEILQSRATLQPGFSQRFAEITTLVLTTHSKIATGP